MRLRRSRERDRESAQLAVQIASKAHAKALRQGLDLDVGGTARRPMWLEQKE